MQSLSLTLTNNFIETPGDFLFSFDNLQLQFIGNEANLTNTVALINFRIICAQGDNTAMTGESIFASNRLFTDPVRLQPIFFYVALTGPNNVTMTDNLFSSHYMDLDLGTTVMAGIILSCIPQDDLSQDIVFNNNVVTVDPNAEDGRNTMITTVID